MRNHQILKVIYIAVAVIATATFASCFQKTHFFEYKSINIDGWERNDFVDYRVKAVEEDGFYTEIIGVRANNDYPFKTLSLIINQNVVSNTNMRRNSFKSDTLTIDIYDNEGMINGSGVNLHQFEIPFKTMKMQKGDSLYLTIRHNMSRRVIEGISDVGVIMSHP